MEGMTKEQRKKFKKRQKEKEKKVALKDAPPPAAPAAASAAAPKKKVPRAIALILAQQEAERKRKQEEERRIREEEERLRKQQEEEEKLRAEEEKKKQERKERRKVQAKEAEKRKAERERLERLARYGFTANTKAPGAGGDAAALKPAQKKPQSSMYSSKKKGKPQVAGKVQNGSPQESQPEASPEQQQQRSQEETSWEEKAAQVESWEEHAEETKESWETTDVEVAPSISKPSPVEPVKSPSPQPAATKSVAQPEVKPEPASDDKPAGEQKRPVKDLRSPICCILGHVDTGKTKLLDKIRQTNVQGGEAGGITQQIGASYFPGKTLQEKTKSLAQKFKFQVKVPGLLIIDTPGHESFSNLRSRGSSLCDIAILVVDLMHGLEPQTLESLKLLRQRKTPFIVALNKVDRLFGWKETKDAPFLESFKKQAPTCKQEFETRLRETITGFAEQGLNAELYYKNKDINNYVSLVPTSAHTGEGIPDLLAVLVQLTQTKLQKRVLVKDQFQATVLEVKVVEGLGTTVDVILVNGILHEGDRIVICGLEGPIATNIRALLTPHPLRELRVKTPYLHHKEVKAAQGVKIAAHGLDKAVAGSALFVVGPDDDEEELKGMVQGDLTNIMKKVQKRGVSVQASTLGSLEALLAFLEDCKIPVGAINIGPVHRSDVIRASVNLEKGKRKEFGSILAFDVAVDKEVRAEAIKLGVKIFTADIIYHLFDQFTKYMSDIKAAEKAEAASKVVFPCVLEIMPDCIFMKKEPIIVGVRVVDGILRIGTPLCVEKKVPYTDPESGRTGTKREIRFIGRVTSLQDNHKEVEQIGQDGTAAVRIEGGGVTFGRQFDETDKLYSQISRESLDALKDHFREILVQHKGMVGLIKKLKTLFDIL